MSRGRIALILIGVLVGLNVSLATLDRWTGGGRPGPDSSTYTTAENGLAAYADLLADERHAVSRLRARADETELDSSTTIVVLDASLSPGEAQAFRSFVASGGRLIAGGFDQAWITGLLDRPPSWDAAPAGVTVPVAPVPEVAGVGRVDSSGGGVYPETGAALPVLTGRRGALAAVATLGDGSIVLLASSAPLRNELLDDADNAAFGLALVGERNRPVVFYEAPHGYGQGLGLRAIPSRARWVIAGLVLAAIVWMLGRARRFGPPEDAARRLAPPRRLFVSSLAGTLARTRRRGESVAPLQHQARRQLQLIAAIPRDAERARWLEAAERFGLSEREALMLFREPTDDAEVIEVGRVFNKLESQMTIRRI
ncbi:MAG: DUF4350 domain-containing protein [Actinomycetota bacterium]